MAPQTNHLPDVNYVRINKLICQLNKLFKSTIECQRPLFLPTLSTSSTGSTWHFIYQLHSFREFDNNNHVILDAAWSLKINASLGRWKSQLAAQLAVAKSSIPAGPKWSTVFLCGNWPESAKSFSFEGHKMLLKDCCFCLPLRTGCILIGVFNLVSSCSFRTFAL